MAGRELPGASGLSWRLALSVQVQPERAVPRPELIGELALLHPRDNNFRRSLSLHANGLLDHRCSGLRAPME
jgi:hypothetical protein